ncbi:MAG: TldD/PmbA family protein [Myxococcales bacterium]|nr:TldD/PmbA family protein [Myxococcales bacterium]
MYKSTFAKELAHLALEEITKSKATYAEVRCESHWSEEVSLYSKGLERAYSLVERGLSVRVLVGGAWGFAAVSEPTRHDVQVVARQAVTIARIASITQEYPIRLAKAEPMKGIYRTKIGRDPMGVTLADKLEYLESILEHLQRPDNIINACVRFCAHRVHKVFLSSEGADIEQDLTSSGVRLRAYASDGEHMQVRTYPCDSGTILGGGWEVLEALRLHEKAEVVAAEAGDLLSAEPCPAGLATVILMPDVLAQHLLHGVAPLFELDRVMGLGVHEGHRTFLRGDNLGSFTFGSPLVNLSSDGRHPSGPGSFGYDDEGVESERVELISQGCLSGFLSGRESAASLGLERSRGAMRSGSWSEPPATRPANILMEPGQGGDIDALIGDTRDGILLEGAQRLSIDQSGYTFAGTVEQGWRIKHGKKVGLVKNISYRGATVPFWRSCDGVAQASEWTMSGAYHPHAVGRLPVGLGAAPARFAELEVGASPPELVPMNTTTGLPIVLLSPQEIADREPIRPTVSDGSSSGAAGGSSAVESSEET